MNSQVNWLKGKKEVGNYTKSPVTTINQFLKKGMPSYKPGKWLLFDPSEVDEWIKKHKVKKNSV